MTIRATIFDMDGVLVDTEPFYFLSGQTCFRELGIGISYAEHETFVGVSSVKVWSGLKKRFDLRQSVEELAAMEEDAQCRQLEAASAISPIAGVPALIEALRTRGHRIGLASSSCRRVIDMVLDRSALRPYFETIVDGSEVVRGKPDPAIFLLAATRLGVDPRSCLVIEDSAAGVRAAKAAGMTCIGFRNPSSGTQDISPADVVVDSFTGVDLDTILDLAPRP